MLEINRRLFIGTFLFAVSIVATALRSKISAAIQRRRLHHSADGGVNKAMRSVCSLNSLVCDDNSNLTAVVDLKLPCHENEVLQNLINDEVILKSILGGRCQRFYVCIHLPSDKPVEQLMIYHYISRLYSRIWDESVQQNKIGMQCIMLCDVLHGLISRQDVIQLPEITHLLSFSIDLLTSTNLYRASRSLPLCETNDTSLLTAPLASKFLSQPAVLLLDAVLTQKQPFQRYKHVALGGTFDRLHFGHRKLLTFALSCCESKLTIGITGDAMLAAKSNVHLISDFNARKGNVVQFIDSIQSPASGVKLDIVQLEDPFGPTITDPEVDAIIVSSETIRGAFKINELRAERSMQPLVILVTYRSDASILSSSFLRDRLSGSGASSC